MSTLMQYIVALHICVGSIFIIVGSFGLTKLPDLMSRLHGPSKATTLGVGGCLIASILYFTFTEGRVSTQEILITFFLFLTAPVTAMFIAKAHLHTSIKQPDSLPATGTKHTWSTFERVRHQKAKGPN